ncbi:MAG: RICIN domain-containing protein [Oscillospiraceae bacterium]|nr:RICIN domain-containing protein [Oscillospiraceae bacterium]
MLKKNKFFLLFAVMLFLCASCAESEVPEASSGITVSENKISKISEDITPGIYVFYNEEKNAYLSFEDRKLIFSEIPQNWVIKEDGKKKFHIYAEKTELLLDIDNAFINEGTEIKIWEFTGYDVQSWDLEGNENSTYSVLCGADNSFCLGFAEGAQLQKRDENNRTQEWKIIKVADPEKNYYSCSSGGGIIELQLPADITEVISKERIEDWAENLEKAFYTFYELTGHKPYETIIVEAYKPGQHIGYVYPNSNIIHIDCDFIREDLGKMAVREIDWNFCALHEMGHMFDFGMPWNFEREVMTDLKVAYVLEINGASAVPSEFDESYNFYGKDIMKAYGMLGSGFSETYDVYSCALRFLEIKEEIGWEPFVKAFHYLKENESEYLNVSNAQKFENFVDLLSLYSGTYIRNEFSQNEWQCIIDAAIKQ